MVQRKAKRTLFTALAVLLVLLVAIGTVTLIRVLGGDDKQDPYLESQSSPSDASNDADSDRDSESSPQEEAEPSTTTDEEATTPTLDPATVSTLTIAPMEIVVSYVKGAGGFEYEVLRTSNGTRYVQFRSAELVGTKCTDDTGKFASILANPNETESATISKTTTVGNVKYGLSLEGAACTSDASKLQTYQKSFSDAFSLLKKTN